MTKFSFGSDSVTFDVLYLVHPRCVSVLQRALAVPVHSESSPFIMPVGEVALTQLQEAILSAIQVLHTVSI